MYIENEKYFFSQKKEDIWLINHFDKIGIIIAVVIILTVFLGSPSYYQIKFTLVAAICVIAFANLPKYFSRKFAYKMTFDFNVRKIHFYMFRTKKSIKANFDDIIEANNSIFLVFFLKDGMKIMWRGEKSEKLLTLLEQITKVTKTVYSKSKPS